MNTHRLLGRSLGILSPASLQRAVTTDLLRALDAAPLVHFDGSTTSSAPQGTQGTQGKGNTTTVAVAVAVAATHNGPRNSGDAALAHRAGVNCLVVEGFEGRL